MAGRPVKHILYVDDDIDDIELFASALHDVCSDVKLTTLTDSKLFMSTLEKISTPDAIVLDVNMPAVDGIQCLKKVRESATFNHIPVVLFSTSRFISKIHEGIVLGANHYVVKGTSIKELSTFINELCTGKLLPIQEAESSLR
jgi:CheY-like chemotaxis protein